MMIKLKKNTYGFTLVELLVVVSMISIISGLGFASLSSYSRQQTVTQAAEDIKQDINLARFNAISAVKPSGQCGTSDTLTGYRLDFCQYSTTPCSSDYQIVALCGSQPVVSSKNMLSSLSLTTDAIAPSEICKSITFTARTGASVGLPCKINVKGTGSKYFQLSVDENGNATIRF